MEPVRSEHVEQREFVQWFRQTHRDVLIFAIPNGGLRDKRVALKLKVEGVEPGVPDLFVPAWGLWIEMKAMDGKVSGAQKDMAKYLESVGYTVFFTWGKKDAIEQVTNFVEARNVGA